MKYISTLDLSKGSVSPESIPKTAFITPTGKYEFVVMPFGLEGAPPVFEQLMNSVLSDMMEFSSSYIDDITVFSQSVEDQVLTRISEVGMTVKPAKCQIARQEYLSWTACGRCMEAKNSRTAHWHSSCSYPDGVLSGRCRAVVTEPSVLTGCSHLSIYPDTVGCYGL